MNRNLESEALVKDHMGFLFSGGSINLADWESAASVPGYQDAMEEAGRRVIAYKACYQDMASRDLLKIWSVFDNGEASEEASVHAAAKAAAITLEEMMGAI